MPSQVAGSANCLAIANGEHQDHHILPDKSTRDPTTMYKITNTKQNCTNCGRFGEIDFNILHHVVVSAEMFPPKKL
jgi:hypothetical protein